jgi:hypothetical protein
MKRTITILSLAFALTVAAFSQAAPAPQPNLLRPERLSLWVRHPFCNGNWKSRKIQI